MDFFRLRFLNTLLLFIVGVVLGFIVKERFYPAAPPPSPAYQAEYPAQKPAAPARKDHYEEEEEPVEEEPLPPEPDEEPRRGEPRRYQEAAREETSAPPAIVIEAAPPVRQGLARDGAAFFSEPRRYEGRELELDLQMITAKKGGSGWRLNLVYSGAGKKIDYLYLEDTQVLPEKPDLRIGYEYKVRFVCGKGETSAGNKLLSIEPTGRKADWATGLSAVE